MPNFWL